MSLCRITGCEDDALPHVQICRRHGEMFANQGEQGMTPEEKAMFELADGLEKFKAETERLHARIEELESTATVFANKDAKIFTLGQELDIAHKDISVLSERVRVLEAEKAGLNSQNAALMRDLNTRDEDIKTLTAVNNANLKRLDDAATIYEQLDGRNKELTASCNVYLGCILAQGKVLGGLKVQG